jgi:hypothetical protein
MMLPMIAGVMLGAPLGVRIGHRLPLARLRLLFVGMMVVVGGKMIVDILLADMRRGTTVGSQRVLQRQGPGTLTAAAEKPKNRILVV